MPCLPASGSATHLFLLLQNHFDTIHGDHDAYFLLLDVLGFKLILQREKRRVDSAWCSPSAGSQPASGPATRAGELRSLWHTKHLWGCMSTWTTAGKVLGDLEVRTGA